MASKKHLNTFGLMGKVEGTYGTAETLSTSADGILVKERPSVELSYIHDGSRGRSPASRSPMPNAKPSGLGANFSAVTEAIGAGAAYSSTVLPNLDVLLRAAGLSATVDATAGAEKVTYAPEADTGSVDSATFEVYERQQKYAIRGAHGENLTISVDGPGVPTWELPFQGIGAKPTDASLPSITSYPSASLLPAKAVNVNLSVNGVTGLKLRGFNFDMGQELSERADDNSAGHAGFTPGQVDPSLELTVEATDLATLDPYTLRDDATQFAVSMEFGSTQYNRWKFQANKAQVLEVTDDEDGASAIWTLQMILRPSGYAVADNFSVIFD